MYQIAYIGRWETIPETAAAICDHDTPKLEALLQGGLDLDVPIQLSEYIKLMPLEIAVFRNDVPMIHFLLEHGADPGLAEEQPLLLRKSRSRRIPKLRLTLSRRPRPKIRTTTTTLITRKRRSRMPLQTGS